MAETVKNKNMANTANGDLQPYPKVQNFVPKKQKYSPNNSEKSAIARRLTGSA